MKSNKPTLSRVLIMAGGTGGHVFPGLAVAKYLQSQGVEVHWLGTQAGLESQLVPKANIPLHFIKIAGVRRKGMASLLSAPIKISQSIFTALHVIKRTQPDVVLGMGGFVSGPGGIASWLARKPLVIHEQNAIAGLTNKILSRFAKRVLQAFPNSFPESPKVETTGNPVRHEIEALLAPAQRQTDGRPFRLLVLGGSQGAHALNEVLPYALAQIPEAKRPIVMHQTGQKSFEGTKACYASLKIEAQVMPFIDEIDKAYAWADMVLCRSGALTVSEICVAGLGAIFVPYPYAVDDHQTANAQYLVKHDAAICIQQKDLSAAYLAKIMQEFINGPEKRQAMAEAAYALRKPQVAKQIFEICQEVCR